MLALFYSLLIVTHITFGSWSPVTDGRGMPPLLAAHGMIAELYCMGFCAVTVIVVPVAILVCLLVPTWRRFVPYFLLYVSLFFVCMWLMKIAPDEFLRPWWNWWW